MTARNSFDGAAARQRCKAHRKRILDVSQQVTALHIAPAFSCLEIVDCIYNGLMRWDGDRESPDTFLMSKGHGCMAQYAVLESLGILESRDLDDYCTPQGRLGAHPDYEVPGITAATGSLGHGLSMGVGLALAERVTGGDGHVYVLLSDGEVQEGSTWEAIMMATSLGANNLTVFIDNNDFQSLGRTSETHPSFYPLAEKMEAFGWRTLEVNGHDGPAIFETAMKHDGGKPLMVICKTVKGRGVSYMENVPIWHYRAPSPEEYRQAVDELEEIGS